MPLVLLEPFLNHVILETQTPPRVKQEANSDKSTIILKNLHAYEKPSESRCNTVVRLKDVIPPLPEMTTRQKQLVKNNRYLQGLLSRVRRQKANNSNNSNNVVITNVYDSVVDVGNSDCGW